MTFTTRFAPSPTGYLHLGHAFSALTAFEAAKAEGGRFILRIEDIDFTRCRPEYEAAIYEDLGWLGLEWEQPVRRQSEHMADYQSALERLRARGLIYRCFKTRREVTDAIASAPHGPEEVYRGASLPRAEEDLRLAAGEPYAWRLSLNAVQHSMHEDSWEGMAYEEEGKLKPVQPEMVGDVVLARKDTGVAYHLAVVVDDDLQGVTHVIRGEDLADAIHPQCIIQRALGIPRPYYRHHLLILGPDGKRLAKRDKAQTLRELRAAGTTPDEIRSTLGFS